MSSEKKLKEIQLKQIKQLEYFTIPLMFLGQMNKFTYSNQ